ncbi:hypothetical protein BC936DRAFT_142124 [Jimgerdemannia flammicorona]|uniref:superoxide dismutase n=1 Tax=Jimgerdemannia flammicorona TaxID=994334 RepID=A0A433A182_9FUNG|nr:hypothetical protein BC936DRAFT_142124 [Jimgerdemannia flammicorona]
MLSIASRSIKTPVLSALARPFTTAGPKATLPDLPYDYDALEPIISTEIMRLHHSKHHQAYINAFNQAEEKLDNALSKGDLTQQIQLQNIIKFNGGGECFPFPFYFHFLGFARDGEEILYIECFTFPTRITGHINHSLFWQNLAPKKQGGGEHPKVKLRSHLHRRRPRLPPERHPEGFWQSRQLRHPVQHPDRCRAGVWLGLACGLSSFLEGEVDRVPLGVAAAAVGRKRERCTHSSWHDESFMGYNKAAKRLEIATTANQDPLLSEYLTPLLGVDVWEHVSCCMTCLRLCRIKYSLCWLAKLSPAFEIRLLTRLPPPGLLPAVQECSAGLSQGHLGGRELEDCCRALRQGPVRDLVGS